MFKINQTDEYIRVYKTEDYWFEVPSLDWASHIVEFLNSNLPFIVWSVEKTSMIKDGLMSRICSEKMVQGYTVSLQTQSISMDNKLVYTITCQIRLSEHEAYIVPIN